jgi:hypothetical protein
MKVMSADSFCSVIWKGARAACAEESTGSVEASKAILGFPVYTEDYIHFVLESMWDIGMLNLGQSCSGTKKSW